MVDLGGFGVDSGCMVPKNGSTTNIKIAVVKGNRKNNCGGGEHMRNHEDRPSTYSNIQFPKSTITGETNRRTNPRTTALPSH